PTYLHEYFAQHSIDCIKIVPSHWQALELDQQGLLPEQLIIFGGEALSAAVVQKIKKTAKSIRVVNHYGPTEATIGKLLHEIDFNQQYGEIPIGSVFSNTKAYVVNDELALCPVGTPGELLLGGDGISSGYLNRPTLTSTRFIDNPFASEPRKLYRTGDSVRMLPNGALVFIGRIDDQVKVRGYRVELGEVQTNLEESPLVKRAIVLAKKDANGIPQLIAYVIPERTFDKTRIQDDLKAKLPDYMVPSIFVEMEAFPLTANGKIDRKQLPDPEQTGIDRIPFVAPRNDLERRIAEIWRERLKLDKVGIHDDFFELGGHSLLAIRVVLSFRRKLKKKIEIKDIFEYPTIASMADFLHQLEASFTLPAIIAKERPQKIPVSDGQKRLWTIHQLEGSTHYHIHHLQRFHDHLDVDAFESAINDLINRHEILRTVFYEADEAVYQHIMPKDHWKMQVDELDQATSFDQIRSIVREEANKAFDLSADHPLRARLLRYDTESYLLILVVHHIAMDGWSKDILISDLLELYRARAERRSNKLKPLSIQFADYAIWQQTFLDQKTEEQQLAYWNEKLKGTPLLELPNDQSHMMVQEAIGGAIKFKANAVLTQQLREVCKKEGVTLYMLILAGLNVLISRY
ncbi:MAG: condensation domain-containing protein, partial [Bacteroidota bacterium]